VSARAKPRGETILEAKDIVNRFGKKVVHDHLNLEVRRGEVFGIAGGSGSGKSVLLRTLCGLRRPNSGKVLIEGKPVESLKGAERAGLIGVLFQQGALFSSLSVAQNVMLPMREHTALAPADCDAIAGMKLELAGLPLDSATQLPDELSGGMVKRAALARALALDPRILFLDEPTSGLDPLTAGGIDELIHNLSTGLGVTLVIVTHDLTTLFTVCDRVAILAEGHLTIGTVDQLAHSRQTWVRELFHGPRARGAMNARSQAHGT
jgi:phospholipid/cholesterol/gamma-HCH transport system ATP-binding protein